MMHLRALRASSTSTYARKTQQHLATSPIHTATHGRAHAMGAQNESGKAKRADGTSGGVFSVPQVPSESSRRYCRARGHSHIAPQHSIHVARATGGHAAWSPHLVLLLPRLASNKSYTSHREGAPPGRPNFERLPSRTRQETRRKEVAPASHMASASPIRSLRQRSPESGWKSTARSVARALRSSRAGGRRLQQAGVRPTRMAKAVAPGGTLSDARRRQPPPSRQPASRRRTPTPTTDRARWQRQRARPRQRPPSSSGWSWMTSVL